MDVALFIGAMLGGFVIAVMASRVAVDGAASLISRTRIPPFVLGITLVALGTDLPEIVNSIVASVAGQGDINVGDSIGSAVTQATLILGLLPLVAGAFVVSRRPVSTVSAATVASLLLGAVLLADGDLTRVDGLILVGAWIAASALVWRQGTLATRDVPPPASPRHRSFLELVGGLAFITGGVGVALWGIVGLAEALEIPAYLISFFGASLGTSLPELVFNVSALRRHQHDLAIGGIFGASLVDATLSIGIGPVVAPIVVTADLALRGSTMAAGVIGLVAMILLRRRRHDIWSGVLLLVLYAAFYPLLLV